ncbi:MAG TPA: hypothetical protein VMZ73_00170 [Acidimicrobiales bacterium]|nr:hypothetical protein [Acidimicrobiales bacterium]
MAGQHLVDDQPAVYRLHGLLLRSALPLSGFVRPDGLHDVDVQWTPGKPVPSDPAPGRLVAAAFASGQCLYAATEESGRWTVRVGGICDFVIDSALDTVECRLDPGADPALAAVLLAGLVVAFLLNVAGECVLHASAVEIDGVAVAFAGPSGAGKSTLAALLCGDGARLITDDVLRLGVDGSVVCVGGGPQLRLRPGAAWTLDEFAVRPPSAPTVDGRLAVRPPPSDANLVPLSALVLPRLSREASTVELRTVRGAASVIQLAAACRVTGWCDPAILRTNFRALTKVATGTEVIEAVIPWGQASPGTTVSALRELGRR